MWSAIQDHPVAARVPIAFMVGVLLALGACDHVVVSAAPRRFGIWLDGAVGYADLSINLGLSTVGNLVGGLLITFTHSAQVRGDG